MKNCAVILASGRAIRMSGVDKMITSVAGKPLISFSIEAFLNCKKFDQIFITANDSNGDDIKEIVRSYSADELVVISGGVRRQDSVKCALDMISNTNVVAIHDGARPLVSEKIIVEGFDLAIKHGSAIPVVPIEDTIKEISSGFEIIRTLDRGKIYRSQTPQFFDFDMLYCAHKKILGDATDDASMLEQIGYNPEIYYGDRKNIKITMPDDILVAEAYLHGKISND